MANTVVDSEVLALAKAAANEADQASKVLHRLYLQARRAHDRQLARAAQADAIVARLTAVLAR